MLPIAVLAKSLPSSPRRESEFEFEQGIPRVKVGWLMVTERDAALSAFGGADALESTRDRMVVLGDGNDYASSITTPEEYRAQN